MGGRSRALSGYEIAMVVFLAIYMPVVLFLYGRQGRWYAAAGWPMIVAGVVAQAVGLGGAFAWGGLAFFGLVALGGLLVIIDLAERRRRRSASGQ